MKKEKVDWKKIRKKVDEDLKTEVKRFLESKNGTRTN